MKSRTDDLKSMNQDNAYIYDLDCQNEKMDKVKIKTILFFFF